MRKSTKSLAALAAALTIAGPLHAATLSVGGQNIGWIDNGGKNWLRLDDPGLIGYNYFDYANGLTLHGYSWRLASRFEIGKLWSEFEPKVVNGKYFTGGYSGNAATGAYGAQQLMAALGYTTRTLSGGHYHTSVGGFASDFQYDIYGVPMWGYSPYVKLDPTGWFSTYFETWTTQSYNYYYDTKSTLNRNTAWMIGTPVSNVPVPASGLLLLSAFGVAGVVRGRGKKS